MYKATYNNNSKSKIHSEPKLQNTEAEPWLKQSLWMIMDLKRGMLE